MVQLALDGALLCVPSCQYNNGVDFTTIAARKLRITNTQQCPRTLLCIGFSAYNWHIVRQNQSLLCPDLAFKYVPI